MKEQELIEHLKSTVDSLQEKSIDIKVFLEKSEKLSEQDKDKLIQLLMERNFEVIQLMKTKSTSLAILKRINDFMKDSWKKIVSGLSNPLTKGATQSTVENEVENLKDTIKEYQEKAKEVKEHLKKSFEEEWALFNSKK